MAQRKPPPGGKPVAKKGTSRPAGKPGAGSTSKVSTSKTAATKSTLAKASAASSGRKPPPRKPGRSIVNQKQTPWGLIATVAAVVLFAGAVIGVVVATSGSSNNKNQTGRGGCANSANANWCKPEIAQAKQIRGMVYKQEPNHTHIQSGTATYDTTPPIGGNHSPYWADCDGTVYSQPIANENAVHALEHGAVWVTYKQGLPADQVSKLAQDVTGQTKVFMSPYPGLSSTVSLQAWGYQLKVNSVTDSRIAEFIAALSDNSSITPEQTSCANPQFKAHPSTFGHPLFAPAAG